MKLLFVIIWTILAVKSTAGEGAVGCRDENNHLVDWYYLYKLPRDSGRDSDNDGDRYLYITSEDPFSAWTESKKKISDPSSFPGNTVSQLYGSGQNLISVMYNDEPPSGSVDFVNGHTKGVVGSDANQGFWLIHSVPHFPPSVDNGSYAYPSTGYRYGQSFLCVTMSSSMIETVGKQLMYNEPTIYSKQLKNGYETKFPNLVKVINGEKVEEAPFWNLETIKSLGHSEFNSFAKSGRFNKELYEDWVAPTLQSDLLVETWLNGPGKIDSNCSRQQRVYNIAEIKIDNDSFSTHRDHSKWAVSKGENGWICVGDINREDHQKVRGGGTLCQKNEVISKFYQEIVQDIEKCTTQ